MHLFSFFAAEYYFMCNLLNLTKGFLVTTWKQRSIAVFGMILEAFPFATLQTEKYLGQSCE